MVEEIEERIKKVDRAKSDWIAQEVRRMIGRVDILLAVLQLQATDESWLASGDKERFRRALEAQKSDLEWVRKQHEVSQ